MWGEENNDGLINGQGSVQAKLRGFEAPLPPSVDKTMLGIFPLWPQRAKLRRPHDNDGRKGQV